MTATQAEKDFFRRRLAGNQESMPDDYIDDIFTDLEAEYSGYSRQVIKQAAIIQGVDDLIMSASTEVDYDEGDASEKRSQIVKNLQVVRKNAQEKLAQLIVKSQVSARWGGMRTRGRYKDKPDNG
jgi:hypothetical protein